MTNQAVGDDESDGHDAAAGMSKLWQPRVLREYSFIADGERGALIGPDGAMVWLCAPSWDSPPVFAALLGGRGGYLVTPADPWFVWGGYYEPGSLIWRSRWVGQRAIECREAMAMSADPHRVVVLRRIEAMDGPARVDVVLELGAGQGGVRELTHAKGVWTGRIGAIGFRWSGIERARKDGDGRLTARVTVPAGQQLDLVLEVSDRPINATSVDPEAAWQATQETWASQDLDCTGLIASRDARHAYAVLGGLTSRSGAMSPPRPPPCPSAWAAFVITTTGTPGSATSATPAWRWRRTGRIPGWLAPCVSSPNGCLRAARA